MTDCPGECSCTIPRSNRSDSCTQEYNRARRNISIRRHTSSYRRSLFRKHHQSRWIDRILKKWNLKKMYRFEMKLIRKLFREILDFFLSKKKILNIKIACNLNWISIQIIEDLFTFKFVKIFRIKINNYLFSVKNFTQNFNTSPSNLSKRKISRKWVYKIENEPSTNLSIPHLAPSREWRTRPTEGRIFEGTSVSRRDRWPSSL